MTMHVRRALLVLITLAVVFCAAQVTNLTGTWRLNLTKSAWAKKQKPTSIVLNIQHDEPTLQYTGTLVDAHGDGRDFQFQGTLDGKEYPFTGPYGAGRIAFRRVDASTTVSTFRSNDGLIVEESRTGLSRNGKVLTHRVSLRDPNGELTWTEVYDKR